MQRKTTVVRLVYPSESFKAWFANFVPDPIAPQFLLPLSTKPDRPLLSTTQLKIGNFLTIKARLGFASPVRSPLALHQRSPL
ncbi:hypothetical protein NDA01_28495 [Trichocoleus desertorum AS-A10]|uniref:hypothetical protein n=1 Tax=Trichocoleus desertorum TaxID=1481672 RepID=UPI00329827DA